MIENHIIRLLEDRPLAGLSEAEVDRIKAHTALCSECRRSYEAAQASLILLQERASASVAPPPFFQTRVLAAIREKNLARKRIEFSNLWRTARPLVASMGAFITMLLMLTFFTENPQEPADPSELIISINDTSTEWVVVEQADDDLTYGQALTVLYDPVLETGDTDER